ncbi:membrane protein [Rhodopirellula sallentina SM41]|uniref:Membrane protein n=1 Tax=Rhodopirellula sallentina SM41 TaxID=1263870 RepID=M5ULN1_9BACT|nr:membrane protein [Rhodopirellula sallentina SM41]
MASGRSVIANVCAVGALVSCLGLCIVRRGLLVFVLGYSFLLNVSPFVCC